MALNKSKLIAPLFVFLFIFVAIFLFHFFSKGENRPTEDITKKEEAAVLPTGYSRISFFLGQPVRASLAIPASWEGKYRVKNSSRSVGFYYIGAPGEELKLFGVYLLKQSSWSDSENSTLIKIKEKNGWLIVYDISTDNLSKASNQKEFQKMNKEINKIIKSIIIK